MACHWATRRYNNFRADIASLFPGLNNTNGAIGFRVIDTTALTNGLHTIAWTVTDNLGATEGIGSRYFRVSNGVAAGLTAALDGASVSVSSEALAAAPSVRSPVLGRLGWDPAAPWRSFGANSSGRVVVRSEEVSRVELHLDAQGGPLTGYLRVADALAPLPVGSRLDADTGIFTWQPGVGFVGSYDLVFVRRDEPGLVARQDVRVVLHAKGSGFVGPQVVIDTPTSQADVGQPFVLGGWAADLSAAEGTGIDDAPCVGLPAVGRRASVCRRRHLRWCPARRRRRARRPVPRFRLWPGRAGADARELRPRRVRMEHRER